MPDKTTIYVVTSGDYSDYGIEAMFSTREKAQAYIDARNLNDYDEGREVNEWIVDEQEGWLMRPQWEAHIRNEPPSIRDRDAAIRRGKEVAYITSYVSPEHALKLAAEVRQQWLREQGIVNAEGSMWLADDGIYVEVI